MSDTLNNKTEQEADAPEQVQVDLAVIDAIVEKIGTERYHCIPILHAIQDHIAVCYRFFSSVCGLFDHGQHFFPTLKPKSGIL